MRTPRPRVRRGRRAYWPLGPGSALRGEERRPVATAGFEAQ